MSKKIETIVTTVAAKDNAGKPVLVANNSHNHGYVVVRHTTLRDKYTNPVTGKKYDVHLADVLLNTIVDGKRFGEAKYTGIDEIEVFSSPKLAADSADKRFPELKLEIVNLERFKTQFQA